MAHRNVFNRDDTMFGICQAIGEDFGFSPNWLRVGFAIALFFAPVSVIIAYFALGVVVLVSRLLVRGPRKAAAPEATAQIAAPAQGDNDLAPALAQAA
jgi:phage shock protein PspC (stress-responsive transcriptional regulator)